MSIDAAPVALAAAPNKRRHWLLGMVLAAALLWPAQYAFWQYHLKRYQAVDEGVVYRTAQPTELGLWYLVGWKDVKTVLSLQMNEMRLCRGLYDPFDASGTQESEFVTGLGARHLQWPMGDEWCWPWVTPWQFDEFFKLLDEPSNLPLAVHCMGGRHRTGTFAALYRLEYDGWPVERVLTEMYSFQFGDKAPLQEYNLRTFSPRPRPTAAQWSALQKKWEALLREALVDYAQLVQRLRQVRQTAGRRRAVEELLTTDLEKDEPFALCLAARCIDEPDDPLVSSATAAAARCLIKLDRLENDWLIAAALIADFGAPHQQQQLIDLLTAGAQQTVTTPRAEAIVAGVTNRYTPNRLALLRPLLDDQRHYLSSPASKLRFCDTAVLRMAAILDQGLMPKLLDYTAHDWDVGRKLARQWFDDHPQDTILSQLLPPSGNTVVRSGAGPSPEEILRD